MEMNIFESVLIYLILIPPRAMGTDCPCSGLKTTKQGFELIVLNTRLQAGGELCMCCYIGKDIQSPSANVEFTRNNVTLCPTRENNRQYKCTFYKHGTFILTIENTTSNDQGQWRCKTAYNSSNPVAIDFITSINSEPSTSVWSYTSSSTSKTTNSKSNTMVWIYCAECLVAIVLVVAACVIWRLRKNKRLPYDTLQRQTRRDTRAVRFHVEESPRVSTSDNTEEAEANDDSHSYSSLSSGASADDLPVTSIVRALVGDMSTSNMENATTQEESQPGASGLPIELSKTERNVLSIVCKNIQKVLTAANESSATAIPESLERTNAEEEGGN